MTSFGTSELQIVRLCKRFPLSLKAIGDSLCNQPIQIWERKVRELSKGSILGADKKLLAYLKSCLDDLDKGMATVKNCFIDLGLFPEDRIIPVTALLDMWAELYEGTEDFLSIANLYELNTRNLARLVVVTRYASFYAFSLVPYSTLPIFYIHD